MVLLDKLGIRVFLGRKGNRYAIGKDHALDATRSTPGVRALSTPSQAPSSMATDLRKGGRPFRGPSCEDSDYLHYPPKYMSVEVRWLIPGQKIWMVALHSKGTGAPLEIPACPDFPEIEGLWALLDLAHKVPKARRELKVSRDAQEPLEIQVTQGSQASLACRGSRAQKVTQGYLGSDSLARQGPKASLGCREPQEPQDLPEDLVSMDHLGHLDLQGRRGTVDLESQELREPPDHQVLTAHKAPRAILAFQGALVFLGVQVSTEHPGLKVILDHVASLG
ncbi:hypothetical protein lerEdw1_002479 [Lerista edwardsae]|nr:hypothetical protein lerEdw1_002479 [Lerista edwardsae]